MKCLSDISFYKMKLPTLKYHKYTKPITLIVFVCFMNEYLETHKCETWDMWPVGHFMKFWTSAKIMHMILYHFFILHHVKQSKCMLMQN